MFSKLKSTLSHLVLSELLVPEHTPAESLDQGCESTCRLSSSAVDCTQDAFSEPRCQGQSCSESVIYKYGRSIKLPSGETINQYSFLFIGDTETATLTNLMMTFNESPFYSYSPARKMCQRETLNVNKALMKRYYLVERAKDAKIVGIVAGTLGVAKYRSVIEHLKKLLQNAGKKSYTFVVGKLNPAKLANFAEIDIYVLVACPESSLLDQSEFYRPIVSPLEMEFACNQAREWTGEYSTDFRDILPGNFLYVFLYVLFIVCLV